MTRITLHKGEDRRIRAGHPWIFSNEIREIVGEKSPGTSCSVFDAGGGLVGTGYYNPSSLIAVRLLSRDGRDPDDPLLFRERFSAARALREALYPGLDSYRLVHGEGDYLPGLVVDRYGDYLSLQFLTAGIDLRREMIVSLLLEMFVPKGIVARNDVAVRGLEGLSQEVEVLFGEVPETLEMVEHGLRFRVDLTGGQKTGHFLDQKENHLLLKELAPGRRVLDCFSYSGSWGVHAAAFGAVETTCVDISERAVRLARQNGEINGVADRMRFEAADAFERLRSLKGEGRRFGLVVLDPPAFVKSKRALKEAEKGYITINRRAMELLDPGGYLVTCSCSFHMGREHFRELLTAAAVQARRDMRLVAVRGQAPDHPVLLSVPETDYLKCFVLQAV